MAFALLRIKKAAQLPHRKKRRRDSAVQNISFDDHAREDYLAGFHKRKQQRIKLAQAEAAKKERLVKIELRKQVQNFLELS